jgi:hypothetical protein
MRTIGKHVPLSAAPDDYPVRDDYSGVMMLRSKLERDGAGLLRDARKRERDRVTLQELEAMNAAAIRRPDYAYDGGRGFDEVEPPVPLESVLAHAGQFWGPSDD